MNARKGNWFLTFTGKKFYPLDPRPEDICIEDIAHALSQICRFGGHCLQFMSVAQHSVLVAEEMHPTLRMLGLMHDASEAYLGDMVRPLKREIHQYQKIEDELQEMIYRVFNVQSHRVGSALEALKHHDDCVLLTERRDLLRTDGSAWSLAHPGAVELDMRIIPQSPEFAKESFLRAFKQYSNQDGN